MATGVLTYRMPCLHDLWIFNCYDALMKVNPDIVIATHGPYVNLIAAWIYTKLRHKKMLWVDFRDLWTGSHRNIGLPGIRTVEKFIEAKILKSAEVVTSVSKNLCLQLDFSGAKSLFLVYNAPISNTDSGLLCARESVKNLVFCYVGTIYPEWQNPTPFFRLLKKYLSSYQANYHNIRIEFASRNAGNFLLLADEFGLRDHVDYRGSVSREESLAMQRQADILLILESNAPEARGVLTGKVFEYLMTDKPILLVGPGPESELYQLLQKHDRLFTLDDLERFLRGEMKTLPKGVPVDYSEISRKQLLFIMDSLVATAGNGVESA
jgi:glycosyltransferase involved in cell wall biosynthesis